MILCLCFFVYLYSNPAERNVARVSQRRLFVRQGMLLQKAGFWDAEKTAPLFLLNKGFVTPDRLDTVLERTSKWPRMVLNEEELKSTKDSVQRIDEEPSRIIIRDAERTFIGSGVKRNETKFFVVCLFVFAPASPLLPRFPLAMALCFSTRASTTTFFGDSIVVKTTFSFVLFLMCFLHRSGIES